LFYAAFVTLGFVFGNSHSHQRACNPADRASDTDSRQRSYNWSRSYEWANTRNRQGADAGQPSQSTPDYRPRASSGRGTFGCFRMFLVGKILRAFILGKQYGNIRVPETRCLQRIYRLSRGDFVPIDSKHCCIFSSHLDLLVGLLALQLASVASTYRAQPEVRCSLCRLRRLRRPWIQSPVFPLPTSPAL